MHCKRDPYDVYIGRPSKWGNPFPVERYGREAAIQLYRDYIVKSGLPLHELEGKVLGCWCAPKPCHGDVLVELLDERTDESPNGTIAATDSRVAEQTR